MTSWEIALDLAGAAQLAKSILHLPPHLSDKDTRHLRLAYRVCAGDLRKLIAHVDGVVQQMQDPRRKEISEGHVERAMRRLMRPDPGQDALLRRTCDLASSICTLYALLDLDSA